MKKENKQELIEDLAGKFQRASSLFLTDFTGMDVKKMEMLRDKFRESHSEFKIVKNTLAKIALSKAGYEVNIDDYLSGPTGIAFGYADALAPAKVIHEFLKDKENDKLHVKICVVEKQIYEASKLGDIARMPNKMDMLAQMVGLLQSPMTNVVLLLSSQMQNLVGLLESLKKKKAA
ncbi:MAG: 50S ribosomal protein L10 [Bacteroidetes bacterium]|nr:50S ribosomal protein L10 [Bacteroidota bacterium]